jgi:hypothetical protein
LLFASIFGNLGRSYLFGAAAGYGKIQSIARQRGINIAAFNMARDLNITDAKSVVELPNLKALEAMLKETGPTALRDFKRKARRIGTPARNEIRKTFREVGIFGPLGAPRRPGRMNDKMATDYNRGRLSYSRGFLEANTSRGIDVNYKNRTENRALAQLARAEDGTISIVRVKISSGPLIVADMAGKTGNKRLSAGQMARNYQTNLFGRGVVQATDRMRMATRGRVDARSTWLEALDRQAKGRKQNKASRYAWPTMEKFMPKHKVNVSQLLNETIAQINKKLEQ